jgi:NADPH2:quinone reductase
MRQAWYDRNGPAAEVLQIAEAEPPVPAPGEVLVRVHASGINPSDCKQRKGWPGREPSGRVVPHSDGAGTIAGVGQGGNTDLIGRRVWIWNARGGAFYGTGTGPEAGTASEYVALPAHHVAPLPDATSFAVGACLGGPGCTAHHLVHADGDVSGQTILVQGGAGAVGELAVAFARQAGAQVIATVSSPRKAAIAAAAGAHHVINYREEDVVAAVRALCPQGLDRILEVDFAANIETDVQLIRQNGIIASYSSPSGLEPRLPYYALQFKGVTVRFLQGASIPQQAQHSALNAIKAGLEAGWLRPTVAAIYPLEQIAEAHEKVESGTALGNVVLSL